MHEILKKRDALFVADACQALRAVHSSNFDAFVIEYWLPDWSGVGLCRQLKANDPHVPIIVVSHNGSKDDSRARALRAKANAFFSIPGGEPDLRSSVISLLHTADAQSLQARIVASDVTQKELKRQRVLLRRRTDAGEPTVECPNERIAKTKALKAFVAAGGTCSHFARWWPQMYAAEVSNVEAVASFDMRPIGMQENRQDALR